MAQAAPIPEVESLLRNRSWMRRLARELVGPELAEDLVQETWVRALESPPRDMAALSVWLRRVLRNLAARIGRRESGRPAREVAAARPEGGRARAGLAQEVGLQRELVDAVLALDEPYQSAILLRFYADMTSVELARDR